MLDVRVVKYSNHLKKKWDQFIKKSKNGTFLFYRDYMEYHSDRFEDFSILFLKNNKIIAVMPANIKKKVIYSHSGLTYGGIISDDKMRIAYMVNIFKALYGYLKNKGIIKLIYKPVPHIYHIIPTEEDLYVLFLENAKLIRRDLSLTIDLNKKKKYNKARRRNITKSTTFGLTIKKVNDFKEFINIEKNILKTKYDSIPTHSAKELELLANRFPENIKLFAVYKNEKMLAGVVIYETINVAHTQYIASNAEGKELFAQDFLLNYLITDYYKKKKYFDFGISTEKNGRYLNKGLTQYKEGFGARSIVYDFYELEVS